MTSKIRTSSGKTVPMTLMIGRHMDKDEVVENIWSNIPYRKRRIGVLVIPRMTPRTITPLASFLSVGLVPTSVEHVLIADRWCFGNGEHTVEDILSENAGSMLLYDGSGREAGLYGKDDIVYVEAGSKWEYRGDISLLDDDTLTNIENMFMHRSFVHLFNSIGDILNTQFIFDGANDDECYHMLDMGKLLANLLSFGEMTIHISVDDMFRAINTALAYRRAGHLQMEGLDGMPDEVRPIEKITAVEQTQKTLEELAHIWWATNKHSHVPEMCLCDIVNINRVDTRLFAQVAELIGYKENYETYKQGVPATDIIA